MKKYIYSVLFILISITNSHAQRRLPRQKGIDINMGTLSNVDPNKNYYLNIGMIVNAKNGNYQLWALEYSNQYYPYKHLKIPHETYTAEGGYSFLLLGDTRRNITLNAIFTAVAGYESINHGKNTLYDGAKILDKDNFIYGGGGRLSVETYLTDHFVLLLQGRTKIMWGTDIKQFRSSAGVGIRFNF
jgi:hypothetical protein